nr:2-dehydropantoate 2-reductase [uncultured Fretibacterium sp.]
MKIAILGAGAMGCLYGGTLAEAGHEVVLIDVWKEHVEALNTSGLQIEEPDRIRRIENIRAVTHPSETGAVELVIVFVKATLTEQAAREAFCLVGEETMVLTLQNGLGNVEKLNSVMGLSHVIAGTTGHGSTLLGPGRIRHAGTGETVIGEQSGGRSERIAALASTFNHAGIATKISENVMGLIWTKLIVNVGINALTAVTGMRNGQLVDYPETESLMRAAIDEACAVARSKGICFEVADPFEHTRNIAKKTAENRSSMLQDVMAKRRTEISVINGAIVELGEKLGIAVPVNAVLTKLITVREKTYNLSDGAA